MSVISVKNLIKYYGDLCAVNNVSFEVQKGELLGFLGVNGAGKSTTINILSTLVKPTSGSAEICGFTLGKNDDRIKESIGIVYQQNCLDDALTVRENLILRGVLHKLSAKQAKKQIERLGDILSLNELLKKPYASLSGGQKRRCEIAASLMHAPQILFLDEPTTGLDPATRKEVWKAIEDLRNSTQMTVFLTTHYMEEASRANRIIILHKGNIAAQGSVFDLKERFAFDHVKLYSDKKENIISALSAMGYNATSEDYGASFTVKNTVDSIEGINAVKRMINGFEVTQGSMDDVFLNACKKFGEKK